MRKPFILLIPLMLLTTGCTHWISEQSRAAADLTVNFSQLRENPDAWRGKLVLLGGTVAAVTRTREGTRLEIVEYSLDSRELPDTVNPSRGRFLAYLPGSLDSDRYKPNALITLIGEVTGMNVQPLAEEENIYPVIAVREIQVIELPEIHPEYDYGNDHHFRHMR